MANDTVEQARTTAVDAIVNPQCTYEDRIRAIDALIAAVRAETAEDRNYWHSQAHLLATELEAERGKSATADDTNHTNNRQLDAS